MLRYCLLLLPLLIAACGSHTGSTSTAAGGASAVSDASATGDFYKRFSGSIAGKPVVVQLQCQGGSVQGSYQYTAVGQVIALRNLPGTEADDRYILSEVLPGEMEDGNNARAEWSVVIHDGKATGEWRSGDGMKHYPIDLAEEYPAGSTRLDAFYMADSAELLPGHPSSPKAATTYSYLLPAGGARGFLYDALRRQLTASGSSDDDAVTGIKAGNAAYFEGYRKENAPLLKETDADMESFTFNYTSDDVISVLYNDDGWLVTESFSSSYTGGAHANYGSSYANIDLQQQRVWKVSDIITDTAALRPMLNDAAIAYFKLKPGAGLDQRMLVDEVPPTDNVYLSPSGLTFVYNPYEIASYADGQVSLFLAYRKLMPFLTPAFKLRMRLSERAGVAMLSILRRFQFSGRIIGVTHRS